MKGYVNIPQTIYVKCCKECGARPIIAKVNYADYVVKCPMSDNHYQTQAGLIDLNDWNRNNGNQEGYSYSLGALTFA